MARSWYYFVFHLMGGKGKWFCTYRNHCLEDFFVWCDLDKEDLMLFWEADNDNDYVRPA